LKQLTPDPWSRVEDTYAVGQVVSGRVTRVAQFGAFVELEAGIEALAHASTFTAQGSQNWTTIVPVGMTATFEIQSIDLAKKRIGVALVAEEERDDYAAPQDDTSTKGLGSMADQLKHLLKPKPD
jgi:small subunit ribosomal protein S1